MLHKAKHAPTAMEFTACGQVGHYAQKAVAVELLQDKRSEYFVASLKWIILTFKFK